MLRKLNQHSFMGRCGGRGLGAACQTAAQTSQSFVQLSLEKVAAKCDGADYSDCKLIIGK